MNIDQNELFTEDHAVNRGKFFKFEKVGDRLFGTYTGKRVGQDGYGNEQAIFEILTPEGEYMLHGAKRRNGQPSVLEKYMQAVKVGQVIGLELTEKRKTSAGKNPANIITPYSDGRMNEEWLKANPSPAEELEEEHVEAEVVDDVPFETEPSVPQKTPVVTDGKELTKEEKVKEIGELAEKKLGANGAADIKTKVMETTEIPFLEKNLDKILEALRKL